MGLARPYYEYRTNTGSIQGFDVAEEPAAAHLGEKLVEGDADHVEEVLPYVAPGQQGDRRGGRPACPRHDTGRAWAGVGVGMLRAPRPVVVVRHLPKNFGSEVADLLQGLPKRPLVQILHPPFQPPDTPS